MTVGRIDTLLIGESAAIAKLRAQIVRFAPTNIPILVQGATGTGKELVALALHLESRRTGNFVAFNVCAVSDSMFEDALFGHVRGAFTGASADHAGYLAEANGGTLFLDEISGAGLASQAKLLRAIETGSFRPSVLHATGSVTFARSRRPTNRSRRSSPKAASVRTSCSA
jgi:DNA-binding NtrC family response regulator